VVEQGVGITALRTRVPGGRHSRLYRRRHPVLARRPHPDAIDVTATITNVRTQCDDSATGLRHRPLRRLAQRTRCHARARTVELPYFSTVVRGGSAVSPSGRHGDAATSPTVRNGVASGTAALHRPRRGDAAADIRERITRRRGGRGRGRDRPADRARSARRARAGDFELLVGFQLTEDQLAYNATRYCFPRRANR
jgi:hypothetical protein